MAQVTSSHSTNPINEGPAPTSTTATRRPDHELSYFRRVGGLVMTNHTCLKWFAKMTGKEVSEVTPGQARTAIQYIAVKIERYGLILRSVGVEFNTLAMLMTQSAPSDVRMYSEDDWFVPHLKLEQFKEGETEKKIRQYLTKLGVYEFISERGLNYLPLTPQELGRRSWNSKRSFTLRTSLP